MCKKLGYFAILIMFLSALSVGKEAMSESTKQGQMIKRGRYLSKIAGCNDCHTPGYLFSEGKVAEKQWLIGDRFGWRGPWGTTYGANLRLLINSLKEDQWLVFARGLKSRPPMPWFILNEMEEPDLRALYEFMRYLGPSGGPAPAYVPPDKEPNTPYALFPSPQK
jgi:mono/diheme cytochrome c family protein